MPDPTPLDEETDEDLLLIVAAGDDDERRRAANAFFRRYVHPLYNFCRQFQTTLGDDDGVAYLVQWTFARAFDRADTYDGTGVSDPAHSRARTFRWLARIATRLFQDWLRSPNEATPVPLAALGKKSAGGALHGKAVEFDERLSYDGDAFDEGDNPDEAPDATPCSPEARCLQEALATLTERERELLLLGFMYDEPGKQLRIPDDVLDEVCRRWGTTLENIRAIRSRANRKLNAYVEAHCRP